MKLSLEQTRHFKEEQHLSDNLTALLEKLGTDNFVLSYWGILPAAAQEWTVAIARGEVPDVDASNAKRKFASLEEFEQYLTGFFHQEGKQKRGRRIISAKECHAKT